MMAADATTGNADTPSQTPPVQLFLLRYNLLSLKISSVTRKLGILQLVPHNLVASTARLLSLSCEQDHIITTSVALYLKLY